MGKEISFTSTHSLPPNDDVSRDFGTAEVGGLDVGSELLRNGWAKIKEFKRDPTEEDLKKKDLEAEAKGAGKGLWNPHGPQVCLPFHVWIHGWDAEYSFQSRDLLTSGSNSPTHDAR